MTQRNGGQGKQHAGVGFLLVAVVCLVFLSQHSTAANQGKWIKAALLETRATKSDPPERVAPDNPREANPALPAPASPEEQDAPTDQVVDQAADELQQTIETAPYLQHGYHAYGGYPYAPYHPYHSGPAPLPSKWRLRRPPIWLRQPGQPSQPWVWVYPPQTKDSLVSSSAPAHGKKASAATGDGETESESEVKEESGEGGEPDTEGTTFYDDRNRHVLRQHMTAGSSAPIAFSPQPYGFHDSLHQAARNGAYHYPWGFYHHPAGSFALPNDWFGRVPLTHANLPYPPFMSPNDPRWVVAPHGTTTETATTDTDPDVTTDDV